MAGRPAKPVKLLVQEGKKHLTKSEIAAREEKEESLRSNTTFRANDKVKNNPIARETFGRLEELYKDIEYVDGLDEAIINRYCLMTAEVDALETLASKLHDEVNECKDAKAMIDLCKTLTNAETTINRTRDMLLKMEDRLFLNPTSRVKNVPPPKKEEKVESKWDAFRGGARNG